MVGGNNCFHKIMLLLKLKDFFLAFSMLRVAKDSNFPPLGNLTSSKPSFSHTSLLWPNCFCAQNQRSIRSLSPCTNFSAYH